MSVCRVFLETTATAHLLDPVERGHVTNMTGTGQTDLTKPDRPQGGTKTAATGALAVEKNPNQKNVPTMTGATAGANAAKRSREAPLPLETGCLSPGGPANAAESTSGMTLLCVTAVVP